MTSKEISAAQSTVPLGLRGQPHSSWRGANHHHRCPHHQCPHHHCHYHQYGNHQCHRDPLPGLDDDQHHTGLLRRLHVQVGDDNDDNNHNNGGNCDDEDDDSV